MSGTKYNSYKSQKLKRTFGYIRNKYDGDKRFRGAGHTYTHQFSSVAQSCPALCDPMECSTPDFSVRHQLPEAAQTHVHRVGDTIQPSHPLSSPPPPASCIQTHYLKV